MGGWTEDIELANPESAARIVEPGDDLRAFLIERHYSGPDLPKPIVAYGHLRQRAASYDSQCNCSWTLRLDDESLRECCEITGTTRKLQPNERYVCSCHGRLIE